ncbi:MAG: carboxy-S-adenosyl-L-methionine synthase CmoA [Planctomycetota bacterium]
MSQKDKLFERINPEFGEFTFDEKVASVFDDMISRSVPLYADVQRAIPRLVKTLDHGSLKMVDLGCSTATTLIQVALSLSDRQAELIGVDNSQAMLDRANQKIDALGLAEEITTYHCDIAEFEFDSASAVSMNYTLQFVDKNQRLSLLSDIRNRILPGGWFLTSEKVIDADPVKNDIWVELYFEHKKRQGYSELEIARKRDALEDVLVPLTVEKNIELLKSAGFREPKIMLKWFNFVTILCQVN